MNDFEWAEKCFLEADDSKVTEVIEEIASILEVMMEGVIAETPGEKEFSHKLATLSQAFFCCQQLIHAWLLVTAHSNGTSPAGLTPHAKKAYDVFTRRMDKTLFGGRPVLASGGADAGDSPETTRRAREMASLLSALTDVDPGEKGWN